MKTTELEIRKRDSPPEVIHEFTLAQGNENAASVMPAWIAGIRIQMDAFS